MSDINPYETPPQLPPNQPVPEKNDRDLYGKLIVLSTFDTSAEAHLFKNELEAQGILSSVSNEHSTPMLGVTIAGPSSAFWYEVLIMESDTERGLEIKNAWKSPAVPALGQEVPEWTCNCGETVDEGFEICWNCGEEFPQQ